MSFKQDSLLKASIIVTILGVLGKILGFGRDAVIASFYGADWRTDAFFLAQSMPGIVFPAVCNSLSTAFLSLFVYKNVCSKKEADVFGSKVLTFGLIFATILSGFAVIVSPVIVSLIAPGFSIAQNELAIHLTRITMAAFVLTMAHYILGAILNAKKLFYGRQIAAFFFNFSVIVITIILGKNQTMEVLTLTVVIGHAIQVLTLCFFMRNQFSYIFPSKVFDDDIRTLLRLTLPILIGNSIVQINNFVDKYLSSLFGQGAMSALSYSNTLNRFVSGIIITTLSTVFYPVLAEYYAKHEKEKFAETIRKSVATGFLVLLPISFITTFCASDIVITVYKRGRFGDDAVSLTSLSLMYYGMMYVFASVQMIMTNSFYSMKDTTTPLKVAAVAIFGNAVMSIVLSRLIGFGGIALGTTLSTLFAAILLVYALKRRVEGFQFELFKLYLSKLIAASFIIIPAILGLKSFLSGANATLRFFIITISIFILYFFSLFAMKCEEVNELKKLFCLILKKCRIL